MATLLEVQNASKRYSDQVLLEDTSVALPDNCKIGMVGRNGCGKSTLIRALVGTEDLDGGEIVRHPTLRLGYLRQHDPFEPGESVMDFLLRDSGQPDWKCGEVANEFAIKGEQLEGPVAKLSGGWQTRVKLAALLLHDPNLLLLDEPTNFLDLRTQILLEHFLRHFRGGCLIVSHDRGFLKATATHTLELARGKLTLFPSDIDRYIEFKEERREHDEKVNATVMAKRKQLETFINKNRANANTASQARNKAKQLERLEVTEFDAAERTVRFHVPESNLRRGTAMRCTNLSIGYGEAVVASDINLEIEHGRCTVIVGDNGQGKTTLLRTLVESLPPVDGVAKWGYGCEIGVYAQHVYTTLTPEDTVFEYLDGVRGSETTTQTLLDIAGSFLFQGDLINKKVKVLSGGERARLCLAGLLLAPHNVLVLDEPGNHLDVETVDALADALNKFQGTILLTSHDRHFVKRIADSVIEVGDGRVTFYPADYDSYLYRTEKEADENDQMIAKPAADKKSGSAVDEKQLRKQQNQERRARQKEVASWERKISQLDGQRTVINKQLLSTTDAIEAQRLHDELTTIQSQIDTAEEHWFELQETEM